MQVLKEYFDEIDESLAEVRRGINTYNTQVDILNVLHRDIMGYVEKSNDQQGFLTELANSLIAQLELTSNQLNAKDTEIKRLQDEIAENKEILQDTDRRLNEAVRDTGDLTPKLATAQRDKDAAERRIETLKQELATEASRARQINQAEIGLVQKEVTTRVKYQKDTIEELQRDLEFANSKLRTLQTEMERTKSTAQQLQTERETQVKALNQRMEKMAQSVTGRNTLATDQSELGTILEATGLAAESTPSQNTRITRPLSAANLAKRTT